MVNNMFANKENKKAISELVSYVLLITLALAMAAAVWFFIRPFAEKPLPEEGCPESVNIVLENYTCDGTSMTYTLRNRGLHNVTGVKLSIINDSSNLEYDFWLYVPYCGDPGNEIPNCYSCGPEADCLPVNAILPPKTTSYAAFNQIIKLVIYPMRVDEKGFYQVCTNAVIKIPISNCT